VKVKFNSKTVFNHLNKISILKKENEIVIDDYFHPTIFCTRSTIKPENYKKKVYTKI